MKQFIVVQAATLVRHQLYAIQGVESSVMGKAHALVLISHVILMKCAMSTVMERKRVKMR